MAIRQFAHRIRRSIWRAVTLVVLIGFLTIPVECDAATAPHSLFLTPAEAGVGRESPTTVRHHGHGDSATSTAGHAHEPSTTADAGDPASQRNAAGGFDLPHSIDPPTGNLLAPRPILRFEPASGAISQPDSTIDTPDPPPPKQP